MEYKFKYGIPEDMDDLIDEIQGYCSRKYRALQNLSAASLEGAIVVDFRERGGMGQPRHNVAWVQVRGGDGVEIDPSNLSEYLREHSNEDTLVVWQQRPFWALVKSVIGFRDNEDLLATQGIEVFPRACAQIDEWVAIGVAQRWN